MKSFELPTNIRQIGTIDEASPLKIYVEDYVCSYLRQYAESGGHGEKVAFLVGKYMVIDGANYVFVSGALQGKHSQFQDNMESFTGASYDYADEQLEKYFPGCEILGWMQSQPGYGVYLNPAYADYHMANFTRPYHLLFVKDPAEKLNLFYAWNKEMSGIDELSGYFVYYDQNKGMQEYMQDNRIARTKPVMAAKTEEAETPMSKLKIFSEPGRSVRDEARREADAATVDSIPASGRNRIGTPASRPLSGTQADKKSGRSIEDMRRLSNLLVGLCAVLFVTCFILGAGLLQSDNRISELETAMMTLDSNNLIIADQVRQLAAVAAFAPSDFAEYHPPAQGAAPPTGSGDAPQPPPETPT
ncbi:MAG: hypothetical protein FWB74_01895, partial [Defluviitaleaceae bacterium]|nr:hypothetical protein [Defluviitaleaceae bacterium]